MDKKDLLEFKEKLLSEKSVLEHELSKMAKTDPKNIDDWIAVPPEPDTVVADKADVADRLEDFEQIRSTEVSLELRLNQVKKALVKIEDGTYETCEVGNEKIPIERLMANPAATTCIKHSS